MKFIHLADLHLGKRVNEFSMLDEQRGILDQIMNVIDREKPDALLIAGDVYDKTTPPAEAVTLFDRFLQQAAARGLQVFIISGNHDSGERLSFGASLMQPSGVHIAGIYEKGAAPVTLTDEWGKIEVHLLPFVKPVQIRHALQREDGLDTWTDALRAAVEQMPRDPDARSVLVAHQFVTGASRSESEEINIGTLDNVDASVFDGFDYVALGHLHRPQSVGRETVRYCGTPLKYSFSEASDCKSVTVVELREKGTVQLDTIPLKPLHDLREIRGSYEQLTLRSTYTGTAVEDYLHITLTDEQEIPDAIGRLRTIYPNVMRLDYDNRRTRVSEVLDARKAAEKRSPLEIFSDFYENQNNQELQPEQKAFLNGIIEEIWGEQV